MVARWETGRSAPDFETVRTAIRAAGYELGITISPTDDHDLGLIRRELRRLPHERLSGMVEAVRKFDEMNIAAHG